MDSEVLLKRQRSPMEWLGKGKNGNHMIDRYMKKEFRNPKDFESYVYISQLLQAQAIKTAAEAHRRNKPYTMGSMYWQINDCWPTISWSTVDYYGNWKAAHYQVRNSYKEMMACIHRKNDSVSVFVVSDKLKNEHPDLLLSVYDFAGHQVFNYSTSLEIGANSSSRVFQKEISEILKGRKKEEVYILTELSVKGNKISESRFFLVPHKSLALPKPQIRAEIYESGEEYTIAIKTDLFAKNIYISFDGYDTNLSDNFFDLEAGGEIKVTFRIKEKPSVEELKKKLTLLTVADSYQ